MFGSNFKISFSSISKALKLKSNIVHNEPSDEQVAENIEVKKSTIQSAFIRKQHCTSNKREHRLDGNTFITNPICIEKSTYNIKPSSVCTKKYDVSNCKIENCCCKSFFREESINRRKRIPLQEFQINQSKSKNLHKHNAVVCKNDVDIKSEFNTSVRVSLELLPKGDISSMVVKEQNKSCNRECFDENDLNNTPNDDFIENKLKGKVLSHGKYANSGICDNNKSKDIFIFRATSNNNSLSRADDTSQLSDKFENVKYRFSTSDATCKVSKKHKIRNIRQIKRLKQMKLQRNNLNRTATFNGYDNLAYRKSIIDINCPKEDVNKITNISACENEPTFSNSNAAATSNYNSLQQYTSKNRMQIYYSNELSNTNNNTHAGNIFTSDKIKECKNTIQTSKLQRHGSFGYFQNESFEHEYKLKRRLSLDELSSKSTNMYYLLCIIFVNFSLAVSKMCKC